MLGVCSVSLNLFVYFPDGKAEERLSTIARKRKSVSGIHFCPFLVAYTHESVSLFHAFRWWGASFKIVRGENEGKKSPLVFFPRLFFAHAGTSYESVNKPFKVHIVVQCYFLFRDIVFCDYEIRGSARVSRPRSSTYEVQPKN